ncbi:hypothetical protein K9K85_01425 [Patescibacteria group bacterium]|nr:hypothetical protein [Patescibacteria group bacterium]
MNKRNKEKTIIEKGEKKAVFGFGKYLVLPFLVTGIMILFSWALSLLFSSPTLSYLWRWGLSYFCLLSLISLFFFLNKNRSLVYSVIGLLAIVPFFFFSWQKVYFLIGLLIFALLAIGYECVHRERKQRVKISLRKSFRPALIFSILAFSLLLATVYYFNPLVIIDQETVKVSSETFRPLIISLEKITINESASVENSLLEDLGLGEKMATEVNKILANFIGPYSQEISLGLTLALFLVLRFIGSVLGVFSGIFSRIIFYFLILIKVVQIKSQNKEVEVFRF